MTVLMLKVKVILAHCCQDSESVTDSFSALGHTVVKEGMSTNSFGALSSKQTDGPSANHKHLKSQSKYEYFLSSTRFPSFCCDLRAG